MRIEEYFPDINHEKMNNAESEWKLWSTFLDALCMLCLERKEGEGSEALSRVGSLLKDVEVAKSLRPQNEAPSPMDESLYSIYEELLGKEAEGLEDGGLLPIARVCQIGFLQPIERLATLMAYAVDRNRKYERIFGILSEETEIVAKPTVGLVIDFASVFLPEESISISCLTNDDSFLNQIIMEPVKYKSGASRLSRVFSLNKSVFQYLEDAAHFDEGLDKLSGYCDLFTPQYFENTIFWHEKELEELATVSEYTSMSPEKYVIQIKGRAGTGKRYLMQALGDRIDSNILCLYHDRLMTISPERREELCRELIIRACLNEALIYLDNVGLEEKQGMEELKTTLNFILRFIPIVYIGSKDFETDKEKSRIIWHTITVSEANARQQIRFWRYFAEKNAVTLTESIDLDEIVSLYNFTPGKIEEIIQSASIDGYDDLDRDTLFRQIRKCNSVNFGHMASRLETGFTWEDIVLSEKSERLLRQACNRIKYRKVVMDEMGFAQKIPYGNGTSVCLYGPPGTGKTMAAQVLAHELGMDLYRIDLSQIESKYIGETQKQLASLFDAANESNVILFFDEADSLFAKRTEVSDSNDRHSNSQVAFLLQKIEEYSGISILTTNAMNNFDNAFKRRMTYVIQLEKPDQEVRYELWKKVFPEGSSNIGDKVLERFAERAELSGSGIKSSAVSAAYIAASRGNLIERDDLEEAVVYEMEKAGHLFKRY